MVDLLDKEWPKGCIPEADGVHCSLRVFALAGALDINQIIALESLLRENKNYLLRLTTRQNFALYGLLPEEVPDVQAKMKAAGLLGMGGGGVVVNADSGLRPGEAFDVRPYVALLNEWFTDDAHHGPQLPGKFKVALSSFGGDDAANASYADLAFYAHERDGQRFFDVYGGGSLGAMPRLALPLEKDLPAEDILKAADALAEVFIDLFEGAKVGKKRMRFKIREIGEAAFQSRYAEKRAEQGAGENLRRTVPIMETPARAWAFTLDAVPPQAQETAISGIYSVKLRTSSGTLSPSFLKRLLDFAKALDHVLEIGLTSDQGILLRSLGGQDVAMALNQFPEEVSAVLPVNCIGADHCRFGLTHPKALLEQLADLDWTRLPMVHISGCMNSCGQHQMALIGLFGRKPATGDPREEGFELYLGGHWHDRHQSAQFGQGVAILTPEEVRRFFERLLKLRGASDEPWAEWLEAHREEVVALAEKG